MATDTYSPIRSGYICVSADAKGQCWKADTRQQRPEEAHQLPERWTHCKGVIWKAGEAETPARPLFLSISSRTSMRHLLGGELRLNCVLICIIVHINEALLYEYSYFLFCCLIKKRRGWKEMGVWGTGITTESAAEQNDGSAALRAARWPKRLRSIRAAPAERHTREAVWWCGLASRLTVALDINQRRKRKRKSSLFPAARHRRQSVSWGNASASNGAVWRSCTR